jgi:hypothetical protein
VAIPGFNGVPEFPVIVIMVWKRRDRHVRNRWTGNDRGNLPVLFTLYRIFNCKGDNSGMLLPIKRKIP